MFADKLAFPRQLGGDSACWFDASRAQLWSNGAGSGGVGGGGACASPHDSFAAFYLGLSAASAALLWLSTTCWWGRWRPWAFAAYRLLLFFSPGSALAPLHLCCPPGSSLVDGLKVLMGECSCSWLLRLNGICV